MIILALEFSSEQRSVAIVRNGLLVGDTKEMGGRSTAALAMIEKVLAMAKMEREAIEAIAVGLGPGSYTGVRSAIALAQGWQLARAIKMTGISSVEAIATGAQAEKIYGRVNVIVNAQREEFYIATYEITETVSREITSLKILPLADIQSIAQKGEFLVGPEAAKFSPNARVIFPHAAAVAQLVMDAGNFPAAEKLEPIYLRETTFVKAPKVQSPSARSTNG